MKKKTLTILMGLSLAAGCTPDHYRREADLQVNKILKDREQRTLEYTPQVQATTQASPKPSKAAYAKIPTTRIPPPTTAPMEPVRVEVPAGPLGPTRLPEEVARQREMPATTTAEAATQPQPQAATRAMPPAVYGPTTRAVQPLRFDLYDSIEYAVQHSRAYQDRMEDLYLAALDVTLQRHLFEPRPFARTGVKYTGDQVDYRSALRVANSVGVRQQLPYGGDVTAEALVDFVQALNDNSSNGESAQLALTASIPLLRGAGMVNLEPLIQSERQVIYEVRNFETFRRRFVVDIASRYFSILQQQQAINNRRMNYASRVALTERTQALYAAGRIRFDEVQRSLQNQLNSENDLANAQDDYQSTLDTFKLLLGMPIEQPLDVVAVALDLEIPDIDAEDVVETAMKYRLDLQTARDQLDDSRRKVQVAQNNLLPDLDFTARGAVGNPDDTPASHLNSRTSNYEAGVTLDLPIDRVSERNTYRRSLVQHERANRGYLTTRDQIMIEVRDAIRSIRQAQNTLDIQRRSIELAQRRLDFNNELLLQGKTDARNVADAQDDLLRAQDAYDRARSNLQVQVLQYLRDTGTLRIDPQAGALGQAMDRAALEGKGVDRAVVDENATTLPR